MRDSSCRRERTREERITSKDALHSGRYLHCIVGAYRVSWSSLDAPGAHCLDLDTARGFVSLPLFSLSLSLSLSVSLNDLRHPREVTPTKHPENPLWTIGGSIRDRSTIDKQPARRHGILVHYENPSIHSLAWAFRYYDTSLAEASTRTFLSS